MEERFSGIGDTIDKMETLAKENVKSKQFLTQNIHEKVGTYEKTKSKNNGYRGKQRLQKIFLTESYKKTILTEKRRCL